MKIYDVKTVEITQEKYEKLVGKSTRLDMIKNLFLKNEYVDSKIILDLLGEKGVLEECREAKIPEADLLTPDEKIELKEKWGVEVG